MIDMTPLTHTELRLAEPSSNADPYELGALEHKAITRAVSHFISHLQSVSREVRSSGGTVPHELARMSNDLDALYRRINGGTITITPDE
jgi:hypothetical protein